MKIAIMQPYFFPYIGYFQLMAVVDEFIILDDVNYIKRGWINRNRILLDGKEKYITKPIRGASQNKLIKDLQFVDDAVYSENMLRTISYAFRKSAFYLESEELIRDIILNPELKVVDYLEYSLTRLSEKLGINVKISRASAYRNMIHSSGQEGIIELCKILGCESYFNAIGGKKLYDNGSFLSEGIKLNFVKTNFEKMKAISKSGFLEYSILEMMADHEIEVVKDLLTCFDVI